MTDNTFCDFKEKDNFYIPIGKIIDLIFEDIKTIHYKVF